MIFKKKNTHFIVFSSLLIICIIAHVLFFIISGSYLITSGLFVIILISLLIYYLIGFLSSVFGLKRKLNETRLIVFTTAICLCIIELLFVLTGYKSTSVEKRNLFYYSSQYDPVKTKRFHLWKEDHPLKTAEYCYYRTLNSDSLSDKEHVVEKNINEYRIIGLGDSFTEGDGTDADSTWLKFLERNVAIKYPLKKQLTYFNAGVCGSDPCFEYILLRERLLKYNPDLVILAINISDINDVIIRGGMERFKPDGSVHYKNAPWWEPLYAMSHISRLFFSGLGYNELLFKENESNFNKAKQKITEIILIFKEFSERNHFKLIVIFHPYQGEINTNHLELHNVMEKVSEEYKIDVLNMPEYFKEKEKINSANSSEYFWKYDGHHNAKGYAAFARGVEWKLKQMGVIDSLSK